MQQINISKNGIITNSAQFETREELDKWFNNHVEMETFGEGFEVELLDLTEQKSIEEKNLEALQFLISSDYKVMKYRDQVDMGTTPDLSVEEYQYLLEQRQQARDAIK